MLELFKEINFDVQELITLDVLVEVSNSYGLLEVRSRKKRIIFCIKICLPYL